MISPPSIITMIGRSHHFFRTRMKAQSSLAIPEFATLSSIATKVAGMTTPLELRGDPRMYLVGLETQTGGYGSAVLALVYALSYGQ
jgi:hypothetical protein